MLLDSWPYYFLGALKKSLEFEQIYIITFHFAVYNARRFTLFNGRLFLIPTSRVRVQHVHHLGGVSHHPWTICSLAKAAAPGKALTELEADFCLLLMPRS